MLIAYVHTTNLSLNDTSETFVINNAISLSAQGIATHLFITNSSINDGLKIIKEKFNIDEIPKNFFLHDIKTKKNEGSWWFCRKVINILSSEEYANATIITRKHSFLPHILLSKKRTQKIFFETHDFFFDLTIRPDLKKSKYRKHSLIEKICFSKLDGLICLNRFQKDLYKSRLDIPIVVFPTGYRKRVDVTSRKLEEEPLKTEDVLLYVGAIEERKGIENLLKLAKILKHKIVILGSRKASEEISFSNKMKEYGLTDEIELRKWQTKKDLDIALRSAKIGLLPLNEGFFNEFLTVPLKYFDYAAFDLPVLGSNFPSLQEYIEDGVNGYLVNWDEVSNVKEKVLSLIDNRDKWNVFSQNQKEKSEKMTWHGRAINQIQYFKNFPNE